MLAGGPNFRAAAEAVSRQPIACADVPEISLTASTAASNPLLWLAGYPGQAAGHAISWACQSDNPDPIYARIIEAIDQVEGCLPAANEVWLCLGLPISGGEGGASSGVAACLSAQELDRVRAFRFEADGWSYAAAHSLLRTMLGRMLRQSPLSLHFDVGEAGKPYLSAGTEPAGGCGLHFSLSHSRGLVAVAVARHPVGVDVERMRPLPDMRELLAELMADEVLNHFDNTPADERTALFHRYWTLAEAFLKARGDGLGGAFADLAFTPGGIPRPLPNPESGISEHWHFGHANGATVDWCRAGPGERE